jgi:uncharacterized membrane-anchored protein YjiN (DUF445 family)
MKLVAAAFLVGAALAFVAARLIVRAQPGHAAGWVGYLQAAGEAGMVGGLADWFAVTALFRRPLGLPIPHTAIIPTRKDAIGQSLGDFVGANFLVEDVIRARVRRASPAGRVGEWLARPGSAERVSLELGAGLRGVMGLLRDEDVQVVIEQAVTSRVTALRIGPASGRLLEQLVADGAHHGLVDLVVDATHTWLLNNREIVTDVIARQTPSWSPRFIDERIAERMYWEAVRVAREVRDDPAHRVRQSFDLLLSDLAQKLQHDPATQARAEELKEGLLNRPEVRQVIADAGATVRRLILEAVDDPESELRRRATALLTELGQRLRTEPQLRAKVDGWIEDVVVHVATNYTHELTTVITDTVQRWDPVETSRKIEIQVGRDLQFIRINGTVVGALAGVAIYAVAQLLL